MVFTQLPQLTLSAESGSGCQKEQTYSKSTDNTTIVLKWLPELQLVSSFSSTRGDIKETWQLTSQQYDQAAIEHFFTELSQYQSTDYADIGDDFTIPMDSLLRAAITNMQPPKVGWLRLQAELLNHD